MGIYLGQLVSQDFKKGHIEKNRDVFEQLLYSGVLEKINSIFRVGISSMPYHKVKINGETFEIGKTGILEIQDSIISSIIFLQDEDPSTIIEFMANVE